MFLLDRKRIFKGSQSQKSGSRAPNFPTTKSGYHHLPREQNVSVHGSRRQNCSLCKMVQPKQCYIGMSGTVKYPRNSLIHAGREPDSLHIPTWQRVSTFLNKTSLPVYMSSLHRAHTSWRRNNRGPHLWFIEKRPLSMNILLVRLLSNSADLSRSRSLCACLCVCMCAHENVGYVFLILKTKRYPL